MPDNWYNSFAKIKAFGKVLRKAKILDDSAKDVFDYFDSPSDYNEAYDLWEELGNPQPQDKEWNAFKDGIEVVMDDEG